MEHPVLRTEKTLYYCFDKTVLQAETCHILSLAENPRWSQSVAITMTRKNPHQNFLKGTVLEDKEIGLGIKDKGQGIRHKG